MPKKQLLMGTLSLILTTTASNNKNNIITSTLSSVKVVPTFTQQMETPEIIEESQKTPYIYINENGTSLKERIRTPENYYRIQYKNNSLGAFLENYTLLKDGEKILLYNGTEKGNQDAHVAIFDMPLVEGDLQQCADSIIRIYAEYFYQTKQYNNIAFHFVSGFLCDFSNWSKGMRIRINGNKVSWYQGAEANQSYQAFERYLRMVFSYASTLSMEQEAKQIHVTKIEPGDIFIHGGSPGHVVMVVDVCKNKQGKKAFLLAQGYMPAQQFHILKNPMYQDDPWYYEEDFSFPFHTPEYTFEEGSLMRPIYEKK